MSPTNSSCIVGGYPLYHNSLVHENNINKLSKIMFGLINMADYYCTFDNIDDILCQLKSILTVRVCIILIAKSGNETWCHDKYRLEGALCFPSPYTHKASVSSIYKPLHEWIWKKKRTRLSKEVICRIYRSCHGPCFGKHRDELANAREVTACAWAFSVE